VGVQVLSVRDEMRKNLCPTAGTGTRICPELSVMTYRNSRDRERNPVRAPYGVLGDGVKVNHEFSWITASSTNVYRLSGVANFSPYLSSRSIHRSGNRRPFPQPSSGKPGKWVLNGLSLSHSPGQSVYVRRGGLVSPRIIRDLPLTPFAEEHHMVPDRIAFSISGITVSS